MKFEKCKHGMIEGTCWLCKGGKQEKPTLGNGSLISIFQLNEMGILGAMWARFYSEWEYPYWYFENVEQGFV